MPQIGADRSSLGNCAADMSKLEAGATIDSLPLEAQAGSVEWETVGAQVPAGPVRESDPAQGPAGTKHCRRLI
jgi:hypothetical protein